MKISNSKKELARIISENGGWRDGAEFAAQDKGGKVFFYGIKPTPHPRVDGWSFKGVMDGYWIACGNELPNWHQTILSREEYFHLYQAPDSKPEFCDSVMRAIPEPRSRPTIEQLAADYQAKLDIATRAQEEADAHRCGAEVALSKLEIAMNELGFKIELVTAKQEPELVITDWRDLQAGDVISVSGEWWEPDSEYTVDENDGSRDAPIMVGGYWAFICECSFKFIRRP